MSIAGEAEGYRHLLFDLIVGASAAFLISSIVCRAMMASGPLDMPTQAHKSHGAPTPTSGGIGIALGFGAGVIVLSLFASNWRDGVTELGASLISAGMALAYGFLALGFVDDAHPLSARLKFMIFTALSVGVALSLGVVQSLPLGWGLTIDLGFWGGLIGTTLWVFTLVNCVNFMDGANGLAMGAVAIGLAALGAIAFVNDVPSVLGMSLSGSAALLGFLVWNFPRGRLFAGDSGALFAGAVAAAAALVAIRRIGLSPFVPAIAFFPLLADALLTLAWRARRGRSLFDGHSEHIYQIAKRAGWGNTRIAVYYWVAMAVCGVIAFYVAQMQETGAPWIALGVLAVVAMFISSTIRKAARKHGIEER